jgi:hypothetical protein
VSKDEDSNLENLHKLLSEAARNKLSGIVGKKKERDPQEMLIIPNQDPIDEEYFNLGEGSMDSSPTKSVNNSEKYVLANYDKPLLNSKKKLSNLLIQERNAIQEYDIYKFEMNTDQERVHPYKEKLEETKDLMRVSSSEGKPKFNPPLPHKQIRLLK